MFFGRGRLIKKFLTLALLFLIADVLINSLVTESENPADSSRGHRSLYAQEFLKNMLTKAPGPLSNPHAELDALSGCIQCHQNRIGGEVAESKCLVCHGDINKRLQQQKGFHWNKSACSTCHAEHKGRPHSIFAPNDWLKAFDHEEAGYSLKGKHAKVACESCHTSNRVTLNTKKPTNSRTYLGPPTACVDCHQKDYQHAFQRKDLLTCTTCHSGTIQSWKALSPKMVFDHDSTKYKLEGLHKPLACRECHQINSELKRVTKFSPLAFDKCTNCHGDPHKGSFGQNCSDCHSVYRKWKNVQGMDLKKSARPEKKPSADSVTKNSKGFDHSRTKFLLTGYHQAVLCESCHYDSVTKFKYSGSRHFSECSDCHGKPHGEQFSSSKCESCHTTDKHFLESTFSLARHEQTKFPLSGKHQVLDCNHCHASGSFQNLPSNECNDCHRNPHDKRQIEHTCNFCHNVTSFSWIQFDHNQNTKFRLTGKHQDVACVSCHLQENFKNMPANNTNPNCQACHDDPHGDSMPNTCQDCHRTEGFDKLTKAFDHKVLGHWGLTGNHAALSCQKCHSGTLQKNYSVPMAKGISGGKKTDCANCHSDIHQGRNGNKCESCHTTDSFAVSSNGQVHDTVFFKLTGAHDQVECNDCHRPDTNLTGMGSMCGTCHEKNDPHLGALGQTCSDCHSQTSWLPTKFRHNQTGFRLTGAHRYLQCSSCHKNQIYAGLPSDCYFCHSDSYIATSGTFPNVVHPQTSVPECSDCHTTLSWKIVKRGGLR